jgi:hypothetical protein
MSHAHSRTFLALAAAALCGCGGNIVYGEMEEPTLVLSQPLGQTVPGAPPIPVSVPQGLVTFTFTVPDIPLQGGSKTTNEAGFTIGSSIKLNQASFIMSAGSNADFNGIDTLTLGISSASQNQILARYTKDPAHPPGKTIVLRPADDVELLDYMTGSAGGKTITLDVSGTGTLPSSDWTADVDLDLHLKVNAGWP